MTPFARATRGRSSLSSLKSRWWGRMSLRRSVGIRVVGIREGLGLRVLGFPRQGRLRCTAPGAKLALIHGGLTLFRRRTGKGRGNGRTGGARVLPHDASDCCHTGFFCHLARTDVASSSPVLSSPATCASTRREAYSAISGRIPAFADAAYAIQRNGVRVRG